MIALAPVNRAVEERTNKRPNMGDLSDSSALEKEADQIMMLYRDEVYNEDSPEGDGRADPRKEPARRNREGGDSIQCADRHFSDMEAA